MKNVRANEALQERWTENAKRERNCTLQNPSLLVLPWKHKAEWVQIEVRKLWWLKVKEWLALQESTAPLNMGEQLKTLKTLKNFSSGIENNLIQIEPSHAAQDFFSALFLLSSLLAVITTETNRRKCGLSIR